MFQVYAGIHKIGKVVIGQYKNSVPAAKQMSFGSAATKFLSNLRHYNVPISVSWQRWDSITFQLTWPIQYCSSLSLWAAIYSCGMRMIWNRPAKQMPNHLSEMIFISIGWLRLVTWKLTASPWIAVLRMKRLPIALNVRSGRLFRMLLMREQSWWPILVHFAPRERSFILPLRFN